MPDPIQPVPPNPINPLPEKSIWKSKTFWIGLLTFVVSLLTFLQNDQFIAQHPKAVAVIGSILGIVMIVLRVLTNSSIKL